MEIVSTDILLQQLVIEENDAMSLDDKAFKSKSVIKTTSEIAKSAKISYPLPNNYVLKRKKTLQSLLSLLLATIFTLLFGYALLTKFSIGGLIVSIVMLSLIYFVLYKNLTIKSINFEIHLSKEGITIAEQFKPWSEIQQTFFIVRPNGRSTIKYFVIGLKNGVLERYHMNNLLEFNMNESSFAALIEKYRHY